MAGEVNANLGLSRQGLGSILALTGNLTPLSLAAQLVQYFSLPQHKRTASCQQMPCCRCSWPDRPCAGLCRYYDHFIQRLTQHAQENDHPRTLLGASSSLTVHFLELLPLPARIGQPHSKPAFDTCIAAQSAAAHATA